MKKGLILAFLALSSSCSGLFYYPTSNIYVYPESMGLKFEEHFFGSLDGTKLHSWYFPNSNIEVPRPKSFTAYFHGNAQNISSHFLNLRWLPENGHEYWIFDYRGYGQSESVSPNQQGTYKDGLAALEFAYELYQKSGAKKFIVYGQSLGGVVLMRALEDFEHKDEVDLIVLDSTFYSYQQVANEVMKSTVVLWPFSFLSSILISDEYAARDFLKENTTDTLIIHSKNDPVVPFSMGERLYNDLKTENKEIWKLDGHEHGDVFYGYGQTYREKFLEKIIAGD